MKKYKNPVCKGSFALGTACGHCERCNDELQAMKKKKPKKKPLVARLVRGKKLWTIWDKEAQDYGFTILCEVPVFHDKKKAKEIVDMWNEQAKGEGKKAKYRLIEAKLTNANEKNHKK